MLCKFSFPKWCFWSFNQDLALPRPEEAQGLDSTHFMSTHCRGSPLCLDHLVAGGDFAAIEPWCRGAGSEWEHRVASTFICASNALKFKEWDSFIIMCTSLPALHLQFLRLTILYQIMSHMLLFRVKKYGISLKRQPAWKRFGEQICHLHFIELVIWQRLPHQMKKTWYDDPHSELCLMRNRDNRAIDLGPARVTAL